MVLETGESSHLISVVVLCGFRLFWSMFSLDSGINGLVSDVVGSAIRILIVAFL